MATSPQKPLRCRGLGLQRMRDRLYGHLRLDRRHRFRDLRRISPPTARSPVLQLYSHNDNIGNYLPTIAIRELLGICADTWSIHDQGMDLEFVNQTYAIIVIGGGGLFHPTFGGFWERFLEECRVPYCIWGVGVCVPDTNGDGARPSFAMRRVVRGARAVILRDTLSAELLSAPAAVVEPCPTVAYVGMRRWSDPAAARPDRRASVLYSGRSDGLLPIRDREGMDLALRELAGVRLRCTDNIQRRGTGVRDIVRLYARSDIVVTTRLHGMIIAAALGVPYVALARDDKMRAFQEDWGSDRGMVVEEPSGIIEAVHGLRRCERGGGRRTLLDMGDLRTGPALVAEEMAQWVS